MAYGIQVDFFLTCGTDEFKESELRLNKKKKNNFVNCVGILPKVVQMLFQWRSGFHISQTTRKQC